MHMRLASRPNSRSPQGQGDVAMAPIAASAQVKVRSLALGGLNRVCSLAQPSEREREREREREGGRGREGEGGGGRDQGWRERT